jgi:hypothetical protein
MTGNPEVNPASCLQSRIFGNLLVLHPSAGEVTEIPVSQDVIPSQTSSVFLDPRDMPKICTKGHEQTISCVHRSSGHSTTLDHLRSKVGRESLTAPGPKPIEVGSPVRKRGVPDRKKDNRAGQKSWMRMLEGRRKLYAEWRQVCDPHTPGW